METGTGNRNYHSDFSAHCVEMPFFHAECIAQCKKEMAAINTDFESGLSGLRTAKAFANEDKELDKFDSANLSYRDSKADFYRAMGRFNAVMEFLCVFFLRL